MIPLSPVTLARQGKTRPAVRSSTQKRMIQRILLTVLYLCALIVTPTLRGIEHVSDLSRLQSNQILQDFSVRNLYSDPNGNITGAKFLHIATGTPIFLLQIETVPQMFMWV